MERRFPPKRKTKDKDRGPNPSPESPPALYGGADTAVTTPNDEMDLDGTSSEHELEFESIEDTSPASEDVSDMDAEPPQKKQKVEKVVRDQPVPAVKGKVAPKSQASQQTQATKPSKTRAAKVDKKRICNKKARKAKIDRYEDVEVDTRKHSHTKDNTFYYVRGFTGVGKPLVTSQQMFDHMTLQIKDLDELKCLLSTFPRHRPIRVATMCSGTEAPMYSLELFQESLAKYGLQLHIEQLFSAEIVGGKQVFLVRNRGEVPVFRDIVEMFKEHASGTILKAKTCFGTEMEVPMDPHLFVAGFCCVDFSSLNQNKKKIEEGGESGDTLEATLGYIMEAQPYLVVLENVEKAPWYDEKLLADQKPKAEALLKKQHEDANKPPPTEREIKSHWEKLLGNPKGVNRGIDYRLRSLGYYVDVYMLDTKDFFIPQTRNRGYLVAVRQDLVSEIDKPRAMASCWEFLRKLSYKATVSAEAMLAAAAEVAEMAPSKAGFISEETKSTPWVRCKVNHVTYRAEKGLGTKHPLTYWAEDGSRLLPDFWTNMKGLTQRVLDVFEVAHLRDLVRGFDDRYYNRFLEASQNVYFRTDTTDVGVIPCLTPSGMPIMTAAGRALTGRECMTLQGLPTERLDLSFLTERELQNFAGNAMTTTVVGAVQMAALLAFAEFFPKENSPSVLDSSKTKTFDDPLAPKDFSPMEVSSFNPYAVQQNISTQALLRHADQSAALCQCEGTDQLLASHFFECTVCRHTACQAHKGNPPHEYVKRDTSGRQSPASFKSLAELSLPKTIKFTNVSHEFAKFEAEIWRKVDSKLLFSEAIRKAFSSVLTLCKIKRSESWEIRYQSEFAKLTLTIFQGNAVWKLYAFPHSDLPAQAPERVQLETYPIATMVPDPMETLLRGKWEIFLPKTTAVKVSVGWGGNLVESFRSQRGLATSLDTFVFEECTVKISPETERILKTPIGGKYRLKQSCGQAFNSLFVKQIDVAGDDDESQRPIFMFFDHDGQCGDFKQHGFVFTHDIRKLGHGQHRDLIARFEPTFHQATIKEVEEHFYAKHEERDNRGLYLFPKDSHPQIVGQRSVAEQTFDIIVDGTWEEFPALAFAQNGTDMITYRRLPVDSLSGFIPRSCGAPSTIFTCDATVPEYLARQYRLDTDIFIDQRNVIAFFRDFNGFIKGGSVMAPFLKANDQTWYSLRQLDAASSHCTQCSPSPPSTLWAWTQKAKRSQLVAFEDPKEAANYEQSYKNRPKAIVIVVRFKQKKVGGPISMHFELGIDPQTLCDQAASLLSLGPRSIPAAIYTQWRLVTDDPKPFTNILPGYLIASTKDVIPHPDVNLTNVELRPEQKKAATQVLNQERTPKPFREMEIVERPCTQLEYRLWAQAFRDIIVCGALTASTVGFGKTAVMIALMKAQTAFDADFSNRTPKVRIQLSATLVVVPPAIMKQWADEIHRFWGPHIGVLSIKDIAQLRKLTIAEFKAARVVLVNYKLMGDKEYTHDMAQFTGSVEPDWSSPDRAKDLWYQKAMPLLDQHLMELFDDPDNLQSSIEATYGENVHLAGERQLFVPTKRITGQGYQDKKVKAGESDKSKDTTSESETVPKARVQYQYGNDINKMAFPLFEMFQFARIIVDEYPYLGPDQNRVLGNIERNSTQLISGTPELNGFSDVKRVAVLLRVNLGIDDPSQMPGDVFKRFLQGMTPSGQLLAFGPPSSNAYREARHRQSQTFIDEFVRLDELSIEAIKFKESFQLVRQSAAERMTYLEQELDSAATDFTPVGQSYGFNQRDQQLKKSYAGYEDRSRRAILHTASSFAPFKKSSLGYLVEFIKPSEYAPFQTSTISCIVNARQRDVDSLVATIFSKFKQALFLRKEFPSAEESQLVQTFEGRMDDDKNYLDPGAKAHLCSIRNDARVLISSLEYSEWYFKKGDVTSANDGLVRYPEGKEKYGGKLQDRVKLDITHVTTTLESHSQKLMTLCPQLRFAQSVRAIMNLDPPRPQQQVAQGPQPEVHVDCCGRQFANRNEIFISAKCGHIFCADCLDHKSIHCPVQHCKVNFNLDRTDLISGTEFGIKDSITEADVPAGCKIDAIVSVLTNIQAQVEKALLFTQDLKSIAELEVALKAAGIRFSKLDSTSRSSKVLEAFKDGLDNATVLLMNIGDSSAAGCNLTIANNILFFAPYYTEGSDGAANFAAAYKQAKGRAVRFGQTKLVNIYHFVTAGTFEVEYLEYRNSRKIVQQGGEYVMVPRQDSNKSAFSSRTAGLHGFY